jgi:hypothetical protein
MNSNLYLGFADGRVRVTRYSYLRDAADMFSWFDDDTNRSRYGICHCWVTEDGSSFVILGDAPQDWSPARTPRESAAAHAHL